MTTVYLRPDSAKLWINKGDLWHTPVVYKLEGAPGWVRAVVPDSALQGGWFHPANCSGLRKIARALVDAVTTVTRDNIEVVIGQRWRDCDKRCQGRVLVVEHVEPGTAYCRRLINDFPEGRASPISICRMYKHSTGFELVSST
jgi:hypothetical protein